MFIFILPLQNCKQVFEDDSKVSIFAVYFQEDSFFFFRDSNLNSGTMHQFKFYREDKVKNVLWS